MVLFACDPLKPLQLLFGKLGDNPELPQDVGVDLAENLEPRVASLGDRLRAVFGSGMLLGWFFVQLWSDVDHLFFGYPWHKNHDPYLPIPEMDMFTPASKESCYKASLCCVILLMILFRRKMSWDMMILKSQRPEAPGTKLDMLGRDTRGENQILDRKSMANPPRTKTEFSLKKIHLTWFCIGKRNVTPESMAIQELSTSNISTD